VQSSSQIITTNKPTPNVLQAGCPSCRPTNSVKALKGKYHTPHGLAYPTHLGVFRILSLTTNSSWLPWRGLPYLSSALWCQHPNPQYTGHVKISCLLKNVAHFLTTTESYYTGFYTLVTHSFSCKYGTSDDRRQ